MVWQGKSLEMGSWLRAWGSYGVKGRGEAMASTGRFARICFRHDFPSDDPRLVYMISTVVDVVDVTPILFDL